MMRHTVCGGIGTNYGFGRAARVAARVAYR